LLTFLPPIFPNQTSNYNVMPPLRRPLFSSNSTFNLLRLPRRFQSSSPLTSKASTTPKASSASQKSRIDRILTRLPRFTQSWTNSLRNAPGSNVVAFLILHELTAIVPLVGLAGLFHWTDWLPTYLTQPLYITEGTTKFGRYFARKSWFGFSPSTSTQHPTTTTTTTGKKGEIEAGGEEAQKAEVEKQWHVGQSSSRILVEVATAYAITKVFLPARILVSVWATPWFARVVVGRVGGGVGRWFSKGGNSAMKTTTGMGAGVAGKAGGPVKIPSRKS